MNKNRQHDLPCNPYVRQPIKKLERLMGRQYELERIRYYFRLTASGQCPHLALIGTRGVGKTSLLNAADDIACQLKLLTVRLDLNEKKTETLGLFWRDLYTTLMLSMAKAGCWGGLSGEIYMDLVKMINGQTPDRMDSVVLQVPYLFSTHRAGIESFECADSLIVHDFQECLRFLSARGHSGIVLSIDEADCLGKNVPLLQCLRNVFQALDSCSLVLAGTDAVFPSLSDVFSPIPRQFHKIEVKAFRQLTQTLEAVHEPLTRLQLESYYPTYATIADLHNLCGGEPAEVQLYSHHMYRSIEDGLSDRLQLVPRVYKDVLSEYRSNAPAAQDAVIAAIEGLSHELLYESAWVSHTGIMIDQNIKFEFLSKELALRQPIADNDRESISQGMRKGYQTLYDSGIIIDPNRISVAGAPFTSGFWKSYVKSEHHKDVFWDDDPFLDLVWLAICVDMKRGYGAFLLLNISDHDDAFKGTALLDALRANEPIDDLGDAFAYAFLSYCIARDDGVEWAVNISADLQYEGIVKTFYCQYIEAPGRVITKLEVEQWIEKTYDIFARSGILVTFRSFRRWPLPTDGEGRQLGWIGGAVVYDTHGHTEMDHAVEPFARGDIGESIRRFGKMLHYRKHPTPYNNLAFCQIVVGDIESAIQNCRAALDLSYEPLFEMNLGVALFFNGETDHAVEALQSALDKCNEDEDYNARDVYSVLLIDSCHSSATPVEDLAIDAALLINLWRLGAISKEEALEVVKMRYPEEYHGWTQYFL